jgi:hypothetical protein
VYLCGIKSQSKAHDMKDNNLSICRVIEATKDTGIFLQGSIFTECFDSAGRFTSKNNHEITFPFGTPKTDWISKGLFKVISHVNFDQTDRYKIQQKALNSQLLTLERQAKSIELQIKKIKTQIKTK